MDKLTMTVPEAARAIGVGTNTAYDMARTGEIIPGVPVIRAGRKVLVPRGLLLRALGSVEAEATA